VYGKKVISSMSVIALIGNKGGAGKTTLAINLAVLLHQHSQTSLLDADPQGSSLHWAAMIDNDSMPTVFDATGDVEDVLGQRRDEVEHILIDCPPNLHSAQSQAVLRHCDIALIPVLPSPLDLWATLAVGEEIEKAKSTNPGMRSLLVINQLEPRTKLSRLVGDAITELNIPAAETALQRRVVYRASVLEGRSVSQMGRQGSIAAEEINRLLTEVLNHE
jgi:chromosome partitioning protein